MEGRIYISSAFKSLRYSNCKLNAEFLDNDPHFWKSPPTWGICRTDFRKKCKVGDYVFFVLPKNNSEGLQCIYGYLKVKEIILHIDAYKRFPKKRMGKKNPNGNIIVNEKGNYNLYDAGAHKSKFERIKKYYIVGDEGNSRLLDKSEIKSLSSSFNNILNKIFGAKSKTNIEIISRKGRVLTELKVKKLLNWINK